MDIKYLRAVFTGGSYCKTRPLTRQDYGITLQFVHPDLPETYQVHFSNSKENTGTAKTQIATATGVTIPDEYLIPGKSVYAWAFVQSENTGRTMKMVEIPVASKPTVTDAPPTPQQRSAIDKAIEALNDGVERAEDAAGKAEEATEHYPRIVNGYWQVWDAEAHEWRDTGVKAVGDDGLPGQPGRDGQDGASGVTYTPTVSADGEISWTNDGGLPNPQPRNITGPTGADGEDGYSPTIAVTDITGGHRVTITDETGAHSFDVMDGQNGVTDVQVAGTSIVQDGAANIPMASASTPGVVISGTVTVSGTTPSITALPGVRYICGEVTTLDITLPASGVVDVTFESGSTATVLTVTPPTGVTLRWANGFDPTALDANTTYEINIADGLGVAAQWT